jgi:uncharacterized protein (TIGR01319 family)
LGAGAKLVGTFAYRLSHADIARIVELAPDILLLAGGTDGGNSEVILHNAAALGASALACPVVLAGNRDAADEALLKLRGREVIVCANVMPEFNVLDIEPARAAIRQVFIDRIVHAKGIDRAQAELDQVLMPTPAAVLEGAKLLADGCAGHSGMGALMVVDPGGATTDVHSVASGEPSSPGIIPQGLPEPRVKRTVEGDLGMRHNAGAIVDAAGLEEIARDARLGSTLIPALIEKISRDVEHLPQLPDEIALDQALVRAAIRLAVMRHCGSIATVYTATGPATVQYGKDLSGVAAVIGTGGALVHSRDPHAVLQMSLADAANPLSLRPKRPKLLLDSEYMLYACGLLGSVEPQAAMQLALHYLQPIDQETHHERTVRV